MYPEKLEDAKKIFNDVKKVATKIKRSNIVLCPPSIYLSVFADKTKSPLFLGAQNTNSESFGSLTGEVSVSQIAHLGLDYVIVGHSERRKMGEIDEDVNKKVKAVVNYGMNAIFCIGETTRDNNGDYLNFIKHQILLGLKDIPKNPVLTPHPKEFERLAGTCKNDYEKWEKLKEFSNQYNVVIVL